MTETILELNERTRQGKNICEICGLPKEMYFVPWCPRCEKPKPYTATVLNLLQCIRHIADTRDDITREEIRDLAIKNWQYEWRNDSYLTWHTIDDDDREDYDDDIIRFNDLMVEVFDPP